MSSALVLFGARILLLVLLYAFLFTVVRALRHDLKSATSRARGEVGPPLASPPGPGVANVLELELLDAGQTALSRGERFPLRDPLLIGRAERNDIALDDDWISAEHVRLRRHNGAWMAEDLGSTNGTRVNGRPLKGPVQVRAGDVVDLGRVAFKLVDRP